MVLNALGIPHHSTAALVARPRSAIFPGSVVGVNTAILSTSGTFSGVGFALPIDTVAKNVGAMIEEGYVSRPSIGVELAPDSVSGALGVPGAMVMKAPAGAGGRWKEGRKEGRRPMSRCSGMFWGS
ncbi:unnamed protein product [Durusdinium trenchii]|uniref:Uncharacterized protein n=2 Tax=Durusdinium trenchii TaxID=1381693 RepID=A0ABP0Q7L1_9DINO